ncbi:RNA recognition motif protein [Ceratobasidium sp. AG-Ba]|nr:RNA recognition motif protein [Ceratobasidium sp. AG-Ba]
MMFDNDPRGADPYADAPYSAPRPDSRNGDSHPVRGRSRSRSPVRRDRSPRRFSPPPRRRSPPPRPRGAPNATPSSVVGVFGLSIRTQERDLDEEFSRFGRVEKVTIVYDQRTDRSRGFGFVRMSTVEEATQCVQELNGLDLNGRRIRVDFSTTEKPHAPTPGEYMGFRMTGVDPTVTMTAVAEIVIMGATAGTGAMAETVVIGVIGSMVVVITGTENTVIAVPLDAAFLRLVAGVATAVPRLVALDPALRVVTMLRLTVPGAGKQSNAYSFWTIFFKAKPLRFKLFLVNVRVESTERCWFMSSPTMIPL